MNMDITYHPISEIEMRKWYFSHDFQAIAEGNVTCLEPIARQYGISQSTYERYISILSSANKTNRTESFDGYNLAIIQGFFKNYYYCADKSITQLVHNHSYLSQYTMSLQSIISGEKENEKIENEKTLEGHSSGLYIPASGVSSLLTDYEEIDIVREDIDNYFKSYSQVFIRALSSAQYGNSGLLEASNIISFKKGGIDTEKCISSADNCDVDSARCHLLTQRKEIIEH